MEFTAASQYGAVGFGAGPQGSATGRRDDVMPTPIGSAASAGTGRAASTTARRVIDDPTFWLVANAAAIIALAAYSAR